MKSNKRVLKAQRQRLDEILKAPQGPAAAERPRAGWLKAVREALGMTSQQLAKRMKLKNHASILKFEKGEVDGSITLDVLERSAQALGCKLIYAIVPESGSFDDLVEARARAVASDVVKRVSHSMKLENQATAKSQQMNQVSELAAELKEKLDSRLWD